MDLSFESVAVSMTLDIEYRILTKDHLHAEWHHLHVWILLVSVLPAQTCGDRLNIALENQTTLCWGILIILIIQEILHILVIFILFIVVLVVQILGVIIILNPLSFAVIVIVLIWKISSERVPSQSSNSIEWSAGIGTSVRRSNILLELKNLHWSTLQDISRLQDLRILIFEGQVNNLRCTSDYL